MATPAAAASDNTLRRTYHLDIHADDGGSQRAVAGNEREREASVLLEMTKVEEGSANLVWQEPMARGRNNNQASANHAGSSSNNESEELRAMREMTAALMQQNTLLMQQAQGRHGTAGGSSLSKFRKNKPPQFSGGFDPEAADLWIQEIEKIFEAMKCPEDMKVTYAAFMLIGNAKKWWKGVKQLMVAEGLEITWESFKEKFLEKYFPETVKQEKEEEFLSLKQGGMSVGEYANKFEGLLRYATYYQLNPEEGWKCRKFESGLKFEIRRMVAPFKITRFLELVDQCSMVESIDKTRVVPSKQSGPIRSGPKHQGGRTQQTPYSRPAQQGGGRGRGFQPPLRCFKCGSQDHLSRECKLTDRICFKCGKIGHLIRECPQGQSQGSTSKPQAVRPQAMGRVYTMRGAESSQSQDLIQDEEFDPVVDTQDIDPAVDV